MRKEILIEGWSAAEILEMPDEQIDGLVLTGEPLVFRAGTAHILGEFSIRNTCLVVALAQINGGGEGVLPTLWFLTEKYARKRQLEAVEWIVHALNCAEPNPKLRPFLERRGFRVENVQGHGEAFHFIHRV